MAMSWSDFRVKVYVKVKLDVIARVQVRIELIVMFKVQVKF